MKKSEISDNLQACLKTSDRRLPNYVAAYRVLHDLIEKLSLELKEEVRG